MNRGSGSTLTTSPAFRAAGLIGGAAALCIAPLLWRTAVGAAGFPAGDAWAYERILRTYHDTGRLEFVGWNDLVLVGMLPIGTIWSSIVGFGTARLGLLGSIMMFVALLGFLDVLGQLGVRRKGRALLVMGLSLPVVGVSGTFLSDSFYFAGVVWSVAFGVRIASVPPPKPRAIWLYAILSGLTAVFGFTIRQHAGATVTAVAIALWASRHRTGPAWMIVAASFAVIAAPLYLWRRGILNGGSEILIFAPLGTVSGLFASATMLRITPIPFLWAARRSLPRWPPLLYWAPAAIAAVAYPLATTRPITEQASLPGQLLGSGSIGAAVAVVLYAATPWSGWLLVRTVTARGDGTTTSVRTIFVVVAVMIALSSGITASYFPRWAILEIALLVALVASLLERDPPVPTGEPSEPTRSRSEPIGLALIALFGLLSYALLDRSVASVGAVYAAADVANCAGVPDARIDGGFVWNGIHSDGVVDATFSHVPEEDGLPPTDEQLVFVDLDRQAVITPTRQAGAEWLVVGPFSSRGLLPGSDAQRWLNVKPSDEAAILSCSPDG